MCNLIAYYLFPLLVLSDCLSAIVDDPTPANAVLHFVLLVMKVWLTWSMGLFFGSSDQLKLKKAHRHSISECMRLLSAKLLTSIIAVPWAMKRGLSNTTKFGRSGVTLMLEEFQLSFAMRYAFRHKELYTKATLMVTNSMPKHQVQHLQSIFHKIESEEMQRVLTQSLRSHHCH